MLNREEKGFHNESSTTSKQQTPNMRLKEMKKKETLDENFVFAASMK